MGNNEMNKSPIKCLGGKSLLANKIISVIPKHETYVEPFFGAGQVFFRKPKSKFEVINDIHGELMNFFLMCKEQRQELINSFEYILTSRDYYNMLRKQNVSKLNKIQKAHRFYYMIRASFGGNFDSAFGTGAKHLNGFQWDMIKPHIDFTHERLINVIVESTDYKKIFEIYDYKDAFFFVDPPYLGTRQDGYGVTFEHKDFKHLNKILENIKGKFLMTHNDDKIIRNFFKNFNIENVGKRRSSIVTREYMASEEIFITNYILEEKHIEDGQFSLNEF